MPTEQWRFPALAWVCHSVHLMVGLVGVFVKNWVRNRESLPIAGAIHPGDVAGRARHADADALETGP